MNFTNKGYIYLVGCGGIYKLGYSVLPEQRVNLIKSDNSKPIKVFGIWEFPRAYEFEQTLHKMMYDDKDNDGFQHVRGEWFKIPHTVLKELVNALDEASV